MNDKLEQAAKDTSEQLEHLRLARFVGSLSVLLFLDGCTGFAANFCDDSQCNELHIRVRSANNYEAVYHYDIYSIENSDTTPQKWLLKRRKCSSRLLRRLNSRRRNH